MALFCKDCIELGKAAIKSMPADLACDAAAAGIAAAIDVAGGGPEDPIADALALAAVGVIERYCKKHGWPWIHSHRSEIAKAMCKAADLC